MLKAMADHDRGRHCLCILGGYPSATDSGNAVESVVALPLLCVFGDAENLYRLYG